MKQVFAIALMAVSLSSFADTTTTGAGAGQQQQQTAVTSTGTASSNNAGNSQQIVFTAPAATTSTSTVNQNVSGTTTVNGNSVVTQTVNGDTTNRQIVSGGTDSTIRQEFGSQTIRNTPSVNGPPLVSSNDTCMGSASGSVNAPGFGLSLGKTYTDTNCVMLKNSREMWNMGMKAAAMALMCTDGANRDALEITGFECPQTTRDKQKQAQAASMPANEPTDPIVRRRMGLPALK